MAIPQRSLRLTQYHTSVLNQSVFTSGELFYDQDVNTLTLFDGSNQGGQQLLRADLSNLQQSALNVPVNLGAGELSVSVLRASAKTSGLNTNGLIVGSPLGYTSTGLLASFVSTETAQTQLAIQNLSPAATAKTNLVLSNNAATNSSNYLEVGIRSSNSTGLGAINAASATFIRSRSSDLTIATTLANSIHFVVNSGTVSADALTINSNGVINITNTTPSLSTTTGSMTIAGGVGIAGASTIGGLLTLNNGLAVTGNINSTTNFYTGPRGFVALADSTSSHYLGFKAPSTVPANLVWTLPLQDGLSDQVLVTNGEGILRWDSPADIGGNFFQSTFYKIPGSLGNFDAGLGESFVNFSQDPFGVSKIDQYDFMDPVSVNVTQDLGVL